MKITRKSILSGIERTREIDIAPEILASWERGEGLIQELMITLSADDREFIMTGSTPEEWDATFKEED